MVVEPHDGHRSSRDHALPDHHSLWVTVTEPTSNRSFDLINSWDTGDVDEIVIESCHSTWIIDMEHSRFRRLVKGSNLHSGPASTEWQPCYGVEHCTQCGGEATSELSLRDLRSAVRG